MKMPFYQWGLVVLVLLVLLLGAGCMQTQSPVKPETESPIPTQTITEPPVRITYQEGLSLAQEAIWGDESGTAPVVPVYFAQGKGVDAEGKAEQWIFGLRNGQVNFFVVVKPDSQVLQPYPMDLPSKEITSSSVTDPALLIQKNRQLFTNAGAREPFILPELELSEGFYTVTIVTGSGNAVLMFDAATGEPVG